MRARKLAPLASILVSLVIACGGQTASSPEGGGSTSVTGTVSGQPVATTDSMGLVGTESSGGVTASYVAAAISNQSGLCSLIQRNGNPANATLLAIGVVGIGNSIASGTYSVSTNGTTEGHPIATATYEVSDAQCRKTTSEMATSGTVTIASVTASDIEGSFDVTFSGGDHLAGNFSVPVCNADLSTIDQEPPTACGG